MPCPGGFETRPYEKHNRSPQISLFCGGARALWLALVLFVIATILVTIITAPTTTHAQQPPPITLTDATGTEVTIDSLDAIVSGSGDITEIIWALGFYDNIVGVDATSTYPSDALDRFPEIGFARRLTVEPVVALNPSVFFCTQICSPDTAFEQLRELGIPVVIIPDSESGGAELPMQKIEMVAQALGVPERGVELSERVRREIDWVDTATVNVSQTPAVLHIYVRGRGIQVAVGDDTPADAMIELAGGVNTGAEVGVVGYQPLSPEIVLDAFPDYLLFAEGSLQDSGGLDAVLDTHGIRGTPAAENGNVIIMDTQLLLGMSIRTGRALLELAAALHPDMTWELDVSYPYTVTDITGTEITVNEPQVVIASNEFLRDITRGLGFHSEFANALPEGSLIIAAESDEWMGLREAGGTVIVVSDNASVDDIAAALNVPGRGVALNARHAGD
jgi:iron complex transport system substrate-binding protein